MAKSADIYGIVEHFPYRTAVVRNHFFTVPRDHVKSLEEALAAAAGVSPDNHTVYGVASANGGQIYIWFTDFTAIFGHAVKEGRW